MSFEALLAEMGELAKSQKLDSDKDKTIAAAAEGAVTTSDEEQEGAKEGAAADQGAAGAEGGEAAGAAAEGGEAAAAGAAAAGAPGAGPSDEEEEEEEENDAPLGKSFTLQLENGDEVEAFDGAELLKSFATRLDASEAGAKGDLAKALEVMTAQAGVLKSQGELIKSLQADVARLANAGSGRRSVQSVAQQTSESALNKSQPAADNKGGIPAQEFLAKCLVAQKEGRLSLHDVAYAETALGSGVAVPQHIVNQAVLSK